MPADSASSAAVSARPVIKTVTAWNGSELGQYLTGPVELTILRVSVPPGASSDWHTNPTPVAVYVMSGELHIEVQGTGERQLIRTGEGFAEIRDLTNRHGTAGAEGAELVVFFAGSPGVPLLGPAVT